MKKFFSNAADFMNIPKHVSNHLCGQNHSIAHRRIVGVVVIVFGVIIAKAGGELFVLHVVFDAFGYALHGIGLIPFIEAIEKK